MSSSADPAPAEAGQLPIRKRLRTDDDKPAPAAPPVIASEHDTATQTEDDNSGGIKPMKRPPMPKGREIRLEQNRKAARESRRRKKVMIEELQRSVVFFSRANGNLKQQIEELSRQLTLAQAQVAAIENQQLGGSQLAQSEVEESQVKTEVTQPAQAQTPLQQTEAQAVATQAVYESKGFPAAAARAAAQTMVGSSASGTEAQASPANPPAASVGIAVLPSMQPGATMQAMASFQQAASAAMQQAVQGMQSVPGMSVQALSATAPAGANPQQAYNDTMTALAMQHAAAAAGQQFFQQNPFMAHPMVAWQNQQTPASTGQQQKSTETEAEAGQQEQSNPPSTTPQDLPSSQGT